MAKKKKQDEDTLDDGVFAGAEGDEVVAGDPATQFKLEGSDELIDYPAGQEKSRRVLYGGANLEHVSDDPDGVWVFRAM